MMLVGLWSWKWSRMRREKTSNVFGRVFRTRDIPIQAPRLRRRLLLGKKHAKITWYVLDLMIVSKIKSGQTNIKHGTLSSVSVAAKKKTRTGWKRSFVSTNLLLLRFLTGRDDFSIAIQTILQVQFWFREREGIENIIRCARSYGTINYLICLFAFSWWRCSMGRRFSMIFIEIFEFIRYCISVLIVWRKRHNRTSGNSSATRNTKYVLLTQIQVITRGMFRIGQHKHQILDNTESTTW